MIAEGEESVQVSHIQRKGGGYEIIDRRGDPGFGRRRTTKSPPPQRSWPQRDNVSTQSSKLP